MDPDPKKMDWIRNTAILVNLCFKNSYDSEKANIKHLEIQNLW